MLDISNGMRLPNFLKLRNKLNFESDPSSRLKKLCFSKGTNECVSRLGVGVQFECSISKMCD
jgi:hypothetical protein